jgi:hypothetical protein
MAGEADWLEYAKLGIAALTPVMTGLVGMFVVRLGNRLESSRTLGQELLRKRLALFEDLAPKLNDIFCFYQAVGHWSELNPDDVIRRKRAIDRAIQVNRYLFRSDFWAAYQQFETLHFEMFSGAGQSARLRLDMTYIRERLGDLFKSEWMPFVSSQAGDHETQRQAYEQVMTILGDEVKGT